MRSKRSGNRASVGKPWKELAAVRASLAIQEKVRSDLQTQLLRLGTGRKRSEQQGAVGGLSEEIATPDGS